MMLEVNFKQCGVVLLTHISKSLHIIIIIHLYIITAHFDPYTPSQSGFCQFLLTPYLYTCFLIVCVTFVRSVAFLY